MTASSDESGLPGDVEEWRYFSGADRSGESAVAPISPPVGRYFDGFARPTDLPTAEVVELHLSFGGKAQVSGLPDNTGFLIRVFPPGAPHEEGGGNHTDLSVVIRYDESLRAVIEGLHLTPEAKHSGSPTKEAPDGS